MATFFRLCQVVLMFYAGNTKVRNYYVYESLHDQSNGQRVTHEFNFKQFILHLLHIKYNILMHFFTATWYGVNFGRL